jgi:hypothetical protein
VENGAGRAGIRGILMPIGGARTTMSQGKISDHEENERLLRGSPVSGPQALPRGNQLNHFGGLPFFRHGKRPNSRVFGPRRPSTKRRLSA